MRANRDTIINLVFGHEKGYVNRPATDNGGATNMGITQKTLSAWRGRPVSIQDVKELKREEAYEIYAKEYWTPIRGDDLPSGLDYALFDSCVTSGANRATRILQQVLVDAGVKQWVNGKWVPIEVDGNLGAQTIDGINRYPGGVAKLVREYCEARVAWMKTLSGPKGFKPNGRGWTIRVLGVDPKGEWRPQPGVVGVAMKMVAKSSVLPMPTVHPEVEEATSAKTPEAAQSLPSIAVKPEAVATIVSTITAVIAAVNGNPILSYTLAGVVLASTGVAGYYFIKRIKTSHA